MKHAYYKMFLRNMKNQNVSFWMSRTHIVIRILAVLGYWRGGGIVEVVIGNGEDNPLKIVDILVTLLPPPLAMTLTSYRGLRSCYSGAYSTRQEFCQTNFIYLLFSSNLNYVRLE